MAALIGIHHAAWTVRDCAASTRWYQDVLGMEVAFTEPGDTQFLWLVNHSKGTATLELDGPGYYWYGSTTGNDEGRGLTGAIAVGGTVPDEARLDRPPQPQP